VRGGARAAALQHGRQRGFTLSPPQGYQLSKFAGNNEKVKLVVKLTSVCILLLKVATCVPGAHP
jgi:hypothetical protein